MKTLELKLKKDILIVDDSENGTYFPPSFVDYTLENESGKWKLLCKGSELTEEIAESLVDDETFYHYDGSEFQLYKNYLDNDFSRTEVGENAFVSPNNSFVSAVENEGFHWLVNPLQSTPPIEDVTFYDDEESYQIAIEQWNLAKSRTLKNPIIFIKN